MQSVYNFFYKWEVTRTSAAIEVIPRVKQCLTHKLHTEFFCEGLFVVRPVAETSTSSRSSISGLTTKRLASTLNDIIYYSFLNRLLLLLSSLH
jgi:hypothetical protein